MTLVRGRLGYGQSIGPDSFADLTDSPATVAWGDGGLVEVTFADDLAPAVRRAVRIRILAEGPADEERLTALVGFIVDPPDTVAELRAALAAVIRYVVQDD